MNCEKCQELLSDFLDCALTDEEHLALSAHMEECLECFHVRRELDEIVGFCRETRGQYEAPPNERALWLRIRNTIESQPGALSASASASSAARRAVAVRPRWWSQWMGRQWELTLPQLAAAVSVIIIAVALGTAFSLQQVKNSQQDAQTAGSMRGGATPGAKALTSDVDDRVRRQQVAIDYWYERVSARKRRWNPSLREAFERNLGVLDQAVEDSRQRLKDNPHDEISEEMLNAALNDKMELLKEFSDQ
jgi:anti-sigma factor RsiW